MLRIVLPVLILALVGNISLAAPLHDAAGAEDVEETRTLLNAGANPDEQGENGETPLTMAILAGHDAVALMLLESGASIEARNRGGFTALHAAAYAGAPEIASALLNAGADVNDRQNKAGVSPARTWTMPPSPVPKLEAVPSARPPASVRAAT
jgi:ankyrin repeat protein